MNNLKFSLYIPINRRNISLSPFLCISLSPVYITDLEAMGLSLEYPNKVFREVSASGRCLVVPATPAVSLIITKNIRDDDDILSIFGDVALFQKSQKN